jgi:hypothetical protein
MLDELWNTPRVPRFCRTLQEPRELEADLDIDDFVEAEVLEYRLCASGILLHEAYRKVDPWVPAYGASVCFKEVP